MKKITAILCIIIITSFLPGCKKYLDDRPAKALQVPSTMKDLQALLDNGFYMNGLFGVSFDETSADNYYYTEDIYRGLSKENQDAYTWSNFEYINYPNDWSHIYNIVNVANNILETLEKIDSDESVQSQRDNIEGSALFFRAYAFLQGAFIFAPAYDSVTASGDPGMVLRLTSDITAKSERASLAETYQQVLSDLQEAIGKLPNLPQHVYRPSKSAALALLARAYLSMRNYPGALSASAACLEIKNDLMDFNTEIDVHAMTPFPQFNKEVLFHNVIYTPNYFGVVSYYTRVDSALVASYAENDLRRTAFFDYSGSPGAAFKGSYSPYESFIGIATDEVWLTYAECLARTGNYEQAMEAFNNFMRTRWVSLAFTPFEAEDASEALQSILRERRKELLFRNLRWMDIKRLNKEGSQIIITREINGNTYILPPNDPRYALPLPKDIIDMTGMPQNKY